MTGLSVVGDIVDVAELVVAGLVVAGLDEAGDVVAAAVVAGLDEAGLAERSGAGDSTGAGWAGVDCCDSPVVSVRVPHDASTAPSATASSVRTAVR